MYDSLQELLESEGLNPIEGVYEGTKGKPELPDEADVWNDVKGSIFIAIRYQFTNNQAPKWEKIAEREKKKLILHNDEKHVDLLYVYYGRLRGNWSISVNSFIGVPIITPKEETPIRFQPKGWLSWDIHVQSEKDGRPLDYVNLHADKAGYHIDVAMSRI
jgi:hypothetical protein